MITITERSVPEFVQASGASVQEPPRCGATVAHGRLHKDQILRREERIGAPAWRTPAETCPGITGGRMRRASSTLTEVDRAITMGGTGGFLKLITARECRSAQRLPSGATGGRSILRVTDVPSGNTLTGRDRRRPPPPRRPCSLPTTTQPRSEATGRRP